MATQTEADKGDFVNNLGKIYGFYTGGFFWLAWAFSLEAA